jgi:glutamate transport system substrate-binding protein
MKSIRRQLVASGALAAMAISLLSACGSSDTPSSGPEPVGGSTGGKLTIGIPFDEPGLGLKSGDGYRGFDVDTATYVAKSMGVAESDITWVEANPEDRETLLTSGKADLIVATYSITDERKQKVDFAGPYFVAHQDLLIRRNDDEITGPDTLNNKRLCSVTGTTSAALVKSKYKGEIGLQEYPKYSECVKALVDGDIDAVTTDDVILAGYAAVKPYKGVLRVVGDGFSDESYGIGVKKGDTEMVTKVNDALKKFISDGSWEKSLDANVGPSGYKLPDPPTPGTN